MTEYLDTTEAARYLSIYDEDLFSLRSQGDGPDYMMIDDDIVYPVSSLTEWRNQRDARLDRVYCPHDAMLSKAEAAAYLGLPSSSMCEYVPQGGHHGEQYANDGKIIAYPRPGLCAWMKDRMTAIREYGDG